MITQPHNVTGCEGGTAMFTCVMRFHNVNISKEDIKWWRRTFTEGRKTIWTQGNKIFRITRNIIEGTLTTILMINDLRSHFMGPYWLEMADGTQLSDMAFLSIIPNGTYVLLYAYCAYSYSCVIITVQNREELPHNHVAGH